MMVSPSRGDRLPSLPCIPYHCYHSNFHGLRHGPAITPINSPPMPTPTSSMMISSFREDRLPFTTSPSHTSLSRIITHICDHKHHGLRHGPAITPINSQPIATPTMMISSFREDRSPLTTTRPHTPNSHTTTHQCDHTQHSLRHGPTITPTNNKLFNQICNLWKYREIC